MSLIERARKIEQSLNLVGIIARITDIEKKMNAPDFWKDHEQAAKLSREISQLKKDKDNIELLNMLIDEGETPDLLKMVEELELVMYLSGKYDANDCYLTVYSGAGGVEAMDWTEMLFRMYTRYCELKGWKFQLVYQQGGEEAGIKTATIKIIGNFAYGYLKCEAGTHRLVRISPFNAQNLRQTSFAGVEILPHVEDSSEVIIKE